MTNKKNIKYCLSKKQLNGIIIIVILLLAVFVFIDKATKNSPLFFDQTNSAESNYDKKTFHGKTFEVVYIVDGDTVDINYNDPKFDHTRIRLLGIDTPETFGRRKMYFGKEASEFASKLCLDKKVTVYLDPMSPTRDKYGRVLAYLQLPNDEFLNEILIKKGYAYADLRFRHSLYHKYKQLQAIARKQKRGLWKEVKREQLPEWLKRERPKLLE